MTACAFDPASLKEQLAATKRKSWSPPQPHSQAEIKAIADLCTVPPECIAGAIRRSLIYLTTSRDGVRSLVISDVSRNAGVAYRLDGKNWEAVSPRTRKPLNRPELYLPGSVPGWPIGLPEAAEFPAVAVVESGIDLVCALHLIWCAERETIIAPIAILRQASMAESALPSFHGKTVCLFPHAGTPQEVCEHWGDQFYDAGAKSVETYSCDALLTNDGLPVITVRDFVRVNVDQWDGEQRVEIEDAFGFDCPTEDLNPGQKK